MKLILKESFEGENDFLVLVNTTYGEVINYNYSDNQEADAHLSEISMMSEKELKEQEIKGAAQYYDRNDNGEWILIDWIGDIDACNKYVEELKSSFSESCKNKKKRKKVMKEDIESEDNLYRNNLLNQISNLDKLIDKRSDQGLPTNILIKQLFELEDELEKLDSKDKEKLIRKDKENLLVELNKVLNSNELYRDYKENSDLTINKENNKIWVTGELDYEEFESILNDLDLVLQQFYPDSYFDIEDSGRAVAYLHS